VKRSAAVLLSEWGLTDCGCNIILAGLPASTIASLQRVQNTATRLVLRRDRQSHITSSPCELHWLPSSSVFSSRLQCSCTKSLPNDVRRTLPTSSPSARQTHSDDLCVQHRPVQPSSDEHVLISDDVHSLFAVQTFGRTVVGYISGYLPTYIPY